METSGCWTAPDDEERSELRGGGILKWLCGISGEAPSHFRAALSSWTGLLPDTDLRGGRADGAHD
jgi:hypothetical protein